MGERIDGAVAAAYASAMRKWWAGGIVAAVAIAGGTDARAQAYKLEVGTDVPILLVGAAATSSFLFLEEAPARTCVTGCDRSKINAFDRWAAGRYDTAWGSLGDVGVAATTLFGPLVVTLTEGLKNGANDSLVILEAIGVTSALQVTMSWAVPRARPRVYNENTPLEERDNANAGRSFFSGHTADAVASVVASSVTLHRLGHHRLAWLVLGAGSVGAGFVGVSRVMSGGHFPSDTIIGAMAGTGLGLALPWLHASPARVTPMSATPDGHAANGLMLSGAW